jgi:hypothetical protein
MLQLSGANQHPLRGKLNRRAFLQAGGLSIAGMALPPSLEAAAMRSGRACILILNVGGPGHLDTFDMKPDAPREYRGPFRPIATEADFQISELFPRHAQVARKFSIVRSCSHNGPAVHDAGWQLMQTGSLCESRPTAPHVGATVAYTRGGSRSVGHVVLPHVIERGGGNLAHGQSGGALGGDYDPLTLDPDSGGFFANHAHSPTGGEFVRLQLDGKHRVRDLVDATLARFTAGQRHTATSQQAHSRLESAAAQAAFDLRAEPPRVRARYGKSRFGRCCLLARRLVERGIPFVTINTFCSVFDQPTWDVHGAPPFTTFTELRSDVAPMYDQAYAALLEDLAERGMLASTLVGNLCEFGRSPRINASGGRDHWPGCFSIYFAGGGVQGGRAIGRSDSIGAAPVERPTGPAAVVATILHCLGVTPGPDVPSKPIEDLF